MKQQTLIAIVDDDESVRESLPGQLKVLGFAARAFRSANEFLVSDCLARAQCLILDINMPGMSGPELQRELLRRERALPTIFITAQSPDCVPPTIFQHGTVACLFKPFSKEDLRAALNAALKKS